LFHARHQLGRLNNVLVRVGVVGLLHFERAATLRQCHLARRRLLALRLDRLKVHGRFVRGHGRHLYYLNISLFEVKNKMSILSDHDRFQLRKMVEAHNVEDNTEKIRNNKHSSEIRRCIQHITDLKTANPEFSKQQLEDEVLKEAGFLFFHYFDIYNLVMKQTDLTVLHKLLDVLNTIEHGECDQHEGSYLVGKYLKELYIDELVRRTESQPEPVVRPPPLEVSWSQYKTLTPTSTFEK